MALRESTKWRRPFFRIFLLDDHNAYRGNEASIKMTYVPPETGIYYLVTAVCDYHVSPLVMKGNLVVENPHGHLPAPQYGSLPFYSVMCVLYVVALFVWIIWCIKYSSEVMSVQIVILVCFVISVVIRFVRE